jgi:hypothetical protein
MRPHFCLLALNLCSLAAAGLRADAPPLLMKALQRWTVGKGDLAFTQETRAFLSDGGVKEERVERYDPSLPDSRRWRLKEVNGVPATDEQRRKWESRKNSRPRTKVDETPSKYLDLNNAILVSETPKDARFKVPVRPEAQRLLAIENIEVVITVDKQTGSIAGIGATLREPIRVLLGVARITDLDVDLRINPVDEGSPDPIDEVESGSTARVKISKLGRPVEYSWSDFKRVIVFAGP